MTKEQLIEMGLTEQQAEKVMESLSGNFVTKKRFDEVNEANKQLKDEIKARDKQLEELKKVDAEALKAEIEKLQEENKLAQEKYEANLKQMQVDHAVERALINAKAKNTKAVKALMADFLANAELEGDSIKGLDNEIKKLMEAEDSKFMFDIETESASVKFKGLIPGERKDGAPGEERPASLAEAVKRHLEPKK